MAYTINKTDGTIIETVEDGTLGTASTVQFIGRNYQSYGEVFNENLIKLLENSSSATQPSAPVEGELWWDKTNDLLYVYTGTSWIPTGSPRIATEASPPTASIQEGTLWYDTTNNQLKGYNGAGFDVIGPAFTAGANQTGIFIETITKTDDTAKTVASIYVAGVRVAIISDETFVAKQAPAGYGDDTFRPGINIQTSGDSTLFRFDGTATNADLLDNISSESFLRSDANDTTTGTIGIATDSGMTIGADGDLSLTVDGSNVLFANVTLDGDIKFTVNDGGITKTPITLDGATGSVGIQNTSPSSSYALDVTGSIHATGDIVIDGDLTLGGSDTDTFTIASDIASHIRPDTNLNFDIGSDTKRWKNVYVGNLHLADNSVATSSSNADLKLETNGTGKVDIIDGGLTSTTGDIDIPANIGITFGDDGEKIEGDGTDLTITASNNLTVDAEVDIILDANGGDVFVKGARQADMLTFLNALRRTGGCFEIQKDGIRFFYNEMLKSVAIETTVHPGFMTDWQPPFTVLLTQAEGMSVVHETVFQDRFVYVSQLQKMGADIQTYDSCMGTGGWLVTAYNLLNKKGFQFVGCNEYPRFKKAPILSTMFV